MTKASIGQEIVQSNTHINIAYLPSLPSVPVASFSFNLSFNLFNPLANAPIPALAPLNANAPPAFATSTATSFASFCCPGSRPLLLLLL